MYVPKLGFLVRKLTVWQPCASDSFKWFRMLSFIRKFAKVFNIEILKEQNCWLSSNVDFY
jgi:hypothetical protein